MFTALQRCIGATATFSTLCLLSFSIEAATPSPAPRAILDTLAAPALEPLTVEMRELAAALNSAPGNEEAAISLAKTFYRFGTAEGDLRFIGYARHVLEPWWNGTSPSVPMRLMRANLRQYVHAFDAALSDLNAVLLIEPANIHALVLRANIHTVRADYSAAREDCGRLLPLIDRLMGAACVLSIDGLTGRAQDSYDRLLGLLARTRSASSEERIWIWGRLAEMAEHLNMPAIAERHFRQALALAPRDQYLLSGLADLLLDQGRPRDVISLLSSRTESEHLLLRLVLAKKALGAPDLEAHSKRVEAGFDAARRGGYAVHEGDESRFALHVLGEPARALELALANWQLQRENRDARAVLEAAVAMNDPRAAKPVLDWMRANDILDQRLALLSAKLSTALVGQPVQNSPAQPASNGRLPNWQRSQANANGAPDGR